MRECEDPTVRAAGYTYAAIGSLELAQHLLPDDHPTAQKLAALINQAKSVDRDVRTIWVDQYGNGDWRAATL